MSIQDQECVRNERERLRCKDLQLYFSADGGASLMKLPFKRTLWARMIHPTAQWPFVTRAFGWYHGKIVAAHDDFHEDGSPNFRYLSHFDESTQVWSSRSYGPVTDYGETWWRSLEFEAIVEVSITQRN